MLKQKLLADSGSAGVSLFARPQNSVHISGQHVDFNIYLIARLQIGQGADLCGVGNDVNRELPIGDFADGK